MSSLQAISRTWTWVGLSLLCLACNQEQEPDDPQYLGGPVNPSIDAAWTDPGDSGTDGGTVQRDASTRDGAISWPDGGQARDAGSPTRDAATPRDAHQPACEYPSFEQDRVVNLDLHTVDVSGTLTLNGGSLLDVAQHANRGSVIFTNPTNGDAVSLEVAPTGPAHYGQKILAGTYDVSFATTQAVSNPGLPQQRVLLAKGVDLRTSRTLDIDLKTVTVSGAITMNGSALPNNTQGYNRGSMVFTEVGTGSVVTMEVGPTGPAQYSKLLFASTYHVAFQPNLSDTGQPSIPTQRVVLQRNVDCTQTRQLLLDFKTATVTGTLTLNGRTWPDSGTATSRDNVVITSVDSGQGVWATLGTSGAAVFSATVMAGTYNVTFQPNASTEDPNVPRQKVLLQSALGCTATCSVNKDLSTAVVSGEIKLDGATMPDATANRGQVVLTRVDTGERTWISPGVGSTGPATFSAKVFTGAYNVAFNADLAILHHPTIPCQDVELASNVEINRDTVLQYNPRTVMIDGQMTLDGVSMPNSPNNAGRGVLSFSLEGSNSGASTNVGATGPVAFSHRLFAGSYRVTWATALSQTLSWLPKQTAVVADHLDLQTSRTLALDLKTVAVSGEVTVNGAAMQDWNANNSRGDVVFVSPMTGKKSYGDLGGVGPARYSMRIFTGPYNVRFEPETYLELATVPTQDMDGPRSCLPAGACAFDPSNLTGTWLVDFDSGGWSQKGYMRLELVQQGQELSGTYSSETWFIGSGSVSNSSVQGTGVQFDVAFAQTGLTRMQATLASGCIMIGYAYVYGGNGSPFIAQRTSGP